MARKPKISDNRIQIRVTAAWLARIETWRSKQRPIPNLSQSIRRLVEMGMEKEKK